MKASGDLAAARDQVIGSRFRSAWGIICAVFREIFDESAYDRFLSQAQTTRSKESYDQFLREQEATAAQRPRCC